MKERKLLVISFINGAGLMTFELVAARLLAPTIGSSTYIWTSVIGVIMAMLALGSWLGGRIADKREKTIDIALLLLYGALAIAAVLAYSAPILNLLAASNLDPRLAGTLASLFLFAPASFIIGFSAPYLAKLNIKSLEDSGRSVANLDSINAVGGIAGTFITGFILFSVFSTTAILLILITIFTITSWTILPNKKLSLRVTITIIIISFVLQAPIAKATAIETSTAHYNIYDIKYDASIARVLRTGPSGYQSGINLNNPDDLIFWYTQKMAQIVKEAPKKDNILILGGGAYTLPRYLAQTYPNSHIDVVEIDPELVNISQKYFYYKQPHNVTHITSDARTYINTAASSYDIILIDIYSDTSVPFTILSGEYGKKIKQLTNPTSVVAANIIADDTPGNCHPFFLASITPYGDNFKYSFYYKDGIGISNIVAVFTDDQDFTPPTDSIKMTPSLQGAPRYNDQYAPAESLQFKCRQ